MARGINKVILLGTCGQDPVVRYLPNGNALTNFSLATNEQWTDKKSGEKVERTEWHRAVFWGRTAEVAGEYLRKGSMAYIEGRLQTRKWTDKEGQERYTTEIRGDRLQLIGGRRDDGQEPRGSHHGGGGGGDMPTDSSVPFDDDEIPFITAVEPLFQPRGLLARVRF